MNKKKLIPALALCLALAGCGWPSSMVSVTPHRVQRQETASEAISVSTYPQLERAMEELVCAGVETATIQLTDYPADALETDLEQVIRFLREDYPIGAYAVEKISLDMGTSMGKPAAAVSVTYRHGWSDIVRIQPVESGEEAQQVIAQALEELDAGVVIRKSEDLKLDFTQMVQDYAREHPQTVMELPQLTQTAYGTGTERVIELNFTYQTDRNSLRRMQSQVRPMFDAALVYVSGDGDLRQKYTQLYSFLMERFDYKVETSITPTYSLLRYGVGDSRAFATVYAAMCRSAGLDCMVVSGTHAGEPWVWNIVQEEESYYHVDLLRCRGLEGYHEFTDSQMEEYVWDYSSYPQCAGVPERTEPSEEETLPPETTAFIEDTAVPEEAIPTEETLSPEETLPTEETVPEEVMPREEEQ